MARQHTLYRLALMATLLAALVIVLGAFTRLTDAGLGCPDWPGCYGHLTVPNTQQAIAQADKLYPGTPVVVSKAWAEMIHRYFAGFLGLLILAIAGISLFMRQKQLRPHKALPILLVGFLFFQVILGMWTVTWKLLPVVVMGHLLGGMTILSLLWLLTLKSANPQFQAQPRWRKLKPFALIGLAILAFQIALGGWVSANYAGLICPNFPFCQGSLFPHMSLSQGFNFFSPIGANYMGGNMGTTARVTIQMIHRYGAMITGLYVGLLGLWLLFSKAGEGLRFVGLALLILLIAQVCLGILNVAWFLPLPVAVAHNGFAALLLLAMVTLNYNVFAKSRDAF